MPKFSKWPVISKIEISHLSSVFLLLISSTAVTYTIFYLAPGPSELFFNLIYQQPFLFLLNLFPVLLLMVLLFFLLRNSVLSSSLTASLFLSLSIINRVKIQLRQQPLLPTDISLISEMMSLLDKFNAAFVITIVVILMLIVLLIIVSLLFFKNQKIKISTRVCGLFTCIFIAGMLNVYLYANDRLYDGFITNGNPYFKVNNYNSKGFTYSFLNDFNSMKVTKPAGYRKSEFLYLQESVKDKTETKKPHIIMIMGEAFSDLSINDQINFDGYTDPLLYYKELITQPNVISGHIIVPNFGGGTADTEFDVLSGCQTSFFENELPSYNFISKQFNGITNQLRKSGYNALAIHPGNYWFYNRENVYDYMGFESFLNLENHFNLDRQGIAGYISDEAATETIIDAFESHKKTSDSPLFEFCVTIQNHGPYTNKYAKQKLFNTTLSISKEQENLLSNYFYGLEAADKQIKDLVTYFEKEEEPVVLVYFGDHLPGFPDGLSMFSALESDIDIEGTPEQRLNLYKTPFFIWENKSAQSLTQFKQSKKKLELPENVTFSAAYLGSMVLELVGLEGSSPFYKYINELRKELPILNPHAFMDKDSEFSEQLTPEQSELLEKWKRWSYYKVFDE